MKFLCLLLCMAWPVLAAPPAGSKPSAQAARGQALSVDQTNATRCGGCHAIAHTGTAIGPDLTRLARLSPRAIVIAIRATRTQYVQNVKLKNGSEFPGMPVAQNESAAQYYDLSSKPPVMRKLDRKDIAAISDNALGQHPPESAGDTVQQLADVIAFIRWASYGDTNGVNPEDVK